MARHRARLVSSTCVSSLDSLCACHPQGGVRCVALAARECRCLCVTHHASLLHHQATPVLQAACFAAQGACMATPTPCQNSFSSATNACRRRPSAEGPAVVGFLMTHERSWWLGRSTRSSRRGGCQESLRAERRRAAPQQSPSRRPSILSTLRPGIGRQPWAA